jgi:hypothetical protein
MFSIVNNVNFGTISPLSINQTKAASGSFRDVVTLHSIASWQHREHAGLHFRHGSSIAIPEADYQRYCLGYPLDYQS